MTPEQKEKVAEAFRHSDKEIQEHLEAPMKIFRRMLPVYVGVFVIIGLCGLLIKNQDPQTAGEPDIPFDLGDCRYETGISLEQCIADYEMVKAVELDNQNITQ